MTGPEHYQEAEKHLEYARSAQGDSAGWQQLQAQVHASLALAAATALGGYQPNGEPRSRRDLDAWREAAGTPASARQDSSR